MRHVLGAKAEMSIQTPEFCEHEVVRISVDTHADIYVRIYTYTCIDTYTHIMIYMNI